MSLEAKEFLDNKQEEHFKQFGVYADVNSKLAEWMQEYSNKQNSQLYELKRTVDQLRTQISYIKNSRNIYS
tara:strand:+ start:1607 stop:1819 length:213 start_codon:yes stop_codon:yes gene_type:complete